MEYQILVIDLKEDWATERENHYSDVQDKRFRSV